MKKIAIFVVVLCAAFFIVKGYFAEKPVMIIGMECDYAPNNWEETRPSSSNLPLMNKEGFYAEGYDLQIAKLIAQDLGMELKVKKIEWNDLLIALNKGEIDAVFSGMLDTDDRKKLASFSNPYEVKKTEYTVIVNKATKYVNAKKLEELYGAKMLGQKGTRLDSAIDQIPGVHHLPPVDTVREMLDKLVGGEIDAIVINVDTGQSYERTYNNLKLLRFPEGDGFIFDFSGICAAVRRQDKDLLAKINKALDGISIMDRKRVMDKTISRVWENL